MRPNPNLSPEQRWAQELISLAEATMPATSEWLAATRARLARSDNDSLRLLRKVLLGQETISVLKDEQFDLYFGLRMLLASRRGGALELNLKRDSAHANESSTSRGARAVARKAEAVLGTPPKAWRWLTSSHAILGDTPAALLESRSGRRLVYDELVRIDWGDLT